MLFLFNDVLFDLGDVVTLLRDEQLPIPPTEFDKLTPADFVSLIKDGIFNDPALPHNQPDKTQHLCALMAYRMPGANAVLAVRYDTATAPEDVGVRFAHIPITTMAYLWHTQEKGALTPQEINDEVWARVTGTLHNGL